MTFAKVFQSGNSQAVRLPKDFRVSSDRLRIFRRGREIVLLEEEPSMREVVDLLQRLSADMDIPEDLAPQERDWS